MMSRNEKGFKMIFRGLSLFAALLLLGSVVVGGLVVATLFTLIVVPLLFSLVLDTKAALGRLLGMKASAEL